MAKPSSSLRCITLRYFHHTASKSSTIRDGISQFITNNPSAIKPPTFSSCLFNSQRTHFSSSANSIPGIFRKSNPHANILPPRKIPGFRYLSFANHEVSSKNYAKKLVKTPGLAFKNALTRYNDAARLQIEAFWRRNYLVVVGAGGFVVCIVLWRVLFGVANTFIGFSEGMAKYGFLALSSAIVAFSGLYLHSRFNINPDKVYRMAMTRLNTSASVLEAMGAPLTGTDLRAYVMSGGGIALSNFYPRVRSKRCFLIFPRQGSDKKGLVSVEVKKNKGQYDMKLLAVDIPVASGPDQRLFLIGDEEEYRIGDGLISELRDPVVKALTAAKEFEARDLKEDEEDDEREIREAERKRRHEIEKLEKGDSQ
ncbi:hypothetical protein PHJA_001082600 [Phtheirospermum japonicum]|uniref:Import inner membrane translocase subunit n=1 Tax=Phtheirospermum japonicum TaxID=374723 RepID=A0A830BTI9_9LAMI|nr:hypothetical protein PHJA_001082600 [Phtheirospermum japonicum]